MWEAYKKDLIEKEKETENFLEQFYNKNDPDFRKLKSMGTHLGDTKHHDTEVQRAVTDNWSKFEEVKHSEALEATILPTWLNDYLRFRFDLLDRVGDGIIDTEEYEYVLSEFNIKEKDSRQAFLLFSHHLTVEVDFPHFVRLFEEYYLSDNPSDLGNFVNGKLDFSSEEKPTHETEEELTEEQKIINQFDLDLYKDDMMDQPEDESKKKKNSEVGKTIRQNFLKMRKRIWKSFKVTCLQSS